MRGLTIIIVISNESHIRLTNLLCSLFKVSLETLSIQSVVTEPSRRLWEELVQSDQLGQITKQSKFHSVWFAWNSSDGISWQVGWLALNVCQITEHKSKHFRPNWKRLFWCKIRFRISVEPQRVACEVHWRDAVGEFWGSRKARIHHRMKCESHWSWHKSLILWTSKRWD